MLILASVVRTSNNKGLLFWTRAWHFDLTCRSTLISPCMSLKRRGNKYLTRWINVVNYYVYLMPTDVIWSNIKLLCRFLISHFLYLFCILEKCTFCTEVFPCPTSCDVDFITLNSFIILVSLLQKAVLHQILELFFKSCSDHFVFTLQISPSLMSKCEAFKSTANNLISIYWP